MIPLNEQLHGAADGAQPWPMDGACGCEHDDGHGEPWLEPYFHPELGSIRLSLSLLD